MLVTLMVTTEAQQSLYNNVYCVLVGKRYIQVQWLEESLKRGHLCRSHNTTASVVKHAHTHTGSGNYLRSSIFTHQERDNVGCENLAELPIRTPLH